MKQIRKIMGIAILIMLFSSVHAYSQKAARVRHAPHHHHHIRYIEKPRCVKAKRAVYKPRWAPKRTFHHRWVYFPRYNFYWDNVKNVYVYREGVHWVTVTTLPAKYADVNPEQEKSVELTDVDDTTESVYDKNEQHVKDYNTE